MKTGAQVLQEQKLSAIPTLTPRQYYALHAPPAPAWWKIKTPEDQARWAWAWADAMLLTEGELPSPRR